MFRCSTAPPGIKLSLGVNPMPPFPETHNHLGCYNCRLQGFGFRAKVQGEALCTLNQRNEHTALNGLVRLSLNP